MRVTARSASELAPVNQFIHDEWFDVDEIVFDEGAGVVTIPFTRPAQEQQGHRIGRVGRLYQVEVDKCESYLRIYHVRHWSVEDSQLVGRYDFNEVKYDPESKIVRITTGVPIVLLAEVGELEVSVE